MKNKKSLIGREAKATVAFFISTLITKGISYLTTPFYTRLLTTEQFGHVTVYFTWVQLFGIIAMFCFMNGVFNNGMLDFPNDRDGFSFSVLILSNIITIAFSIFILLLYPLIYNILNIEKPLLYLMFLTFLTQPALSFWIAKQKYEYKYKLPLVVSISSALFSSLSAVLSILLIGKNAVYERIFGAELVLIAFYCVFYVILAVRTKFRINLKYWKYAFFFNFPLIPHYLSSYILSSSDKIMISRLINDSQAGFYGIAYSIASIALIIWTAINGSLVPYTYEKCKEGNYSAISKIVNPLIAIFGVGCLYVMLLAPEIISILSTEEYFEAVIVVPPIVAGVFFQVLYYLFGNIIFYFKKPVYVTIASITSCLLNIVLNLIFIPRFGYIAAGFTTLVCYIIQAIIDYFLMAKIVKRPVYNLKFILLFSFFVILFSILCMFIYQYRILRISIAVIITLLIFIFYNKIKKVFKILRGKEC